MKGVSRGCVYPYTGEKNASYFKTWEHANWHAKLASVVTLFVPISWILDKNPMPPWQGLLFLLCCYWILYKWWMKTVHVCISRGNHPNEFFSALQYAMDEITYPFRINWCDRFISTTFHSCHRSERLVFTALTGGIFIWQTVLKVWSLMVTKQSHKNVHISRTQPWDPIKIPTFLYVWIYLFLFYFSLGQIISLQHLINNHSLLDLVR